MNTVEGRKVVKLADFRKKKAGATTTEPEQGESNTDRVLDEVSYHLVMAARAIAAQKKRTH